MIRAAALLFGLTVLGGASGALARGPSGDRPGRALFDRAEANFSHGRYADARADYQAAYALEPLPALLFDIAQCYRNLGEYDQARRYFVRYAELEPRSPNRTATVHLAAEMARLVQEEHSRARREPPRIDLAGFAPSPAAADGARRADARGPARPLAPSLTQATTKPAPPIYRRGWFWAGLGGAIAAGAAVAFALSRDHRSGTLAPINAR